MYRRFRRSDPALVFFAIGALACLLVSIPATSAAMDLFHGKNWGWVATGVFEFGAVGLELMSLWIPQWRGRLLLAMIGMLIITTLFNYATGVDSFVSAQLLPKTTYAQIRASDYGWLLAVAASALFPGMLGGFLLGLTARARMVRAKLHTPMAAVAFWLSTYGLSLNTRWQDAEQARTAAEQRAAELEQRLSNTEQALNSTRRDYEQRLNTAEHALSTRPPPMEIEVVYVARGRLTLEQLATLANTSVSTVRRRLPEFTGAQE